MCVEIYKTESKESYKPELSFEEQMCNCKEVLIDCDSNCPKVVKFLDEIEKFCKNGRSLPIKIKLLDNTSFNLFKKTKKLNYDLMINEMIGKMALIHKNADNKLKELSEICSKGSCE